MGTLYHEYYPWESFVTDRVVGHADGSVSLMFSWEGVDNLLFDDSQHHAEFRRRINVLHSLGEDVVIENHFFREHDATIIQEYLAHSKKMVRGQDFAMPVRRAMAAHFQEHARSNSVFVVLSLRNQVSGIKSLFSAKSVKKQASWRAGAERLLACFSDLQHHFPGATCLSVEDYTARIVQSFNRDLFRAGHGQFLDYRFDLAEQLVAHKPFLDGDVLKIGETYTKVALIQNYPELDPSWFLGLCSGVVDLHISQIIFPKNTRKALDKSADRSDSDEATLGQKGRDVAITAIKDAMAYRSYVSDKGLRVFDNAYVLHFHGRDKEALLNEYRAVRDWVHRNDGLVRGDAEIQAHLFRVGMPGAGGGTQFAREDHSETISCMMPVTTFSQGVSQPESIRITSSYQVVGHSPSRLKVGHEFVVAKTGAGKDTNTGCEVIETYPYGMDYLICEFGDSYKWIVEGFGGTYSRIDDDVAINPLPPFSQAKDGVLPTKIVDGTVEGLSIILTDSADDLPMAEMAAASRALDSLYTGKETSGVAPVLPDLLDSLGKLDFPNEEQAAAAKRMYNNLYNFLDSAAGRAFSGQDSLNLSSGITGVDLMAVGDKMLKFYMTFIGLRFAQMAFSSLSNVTKIMLNELHQPVAVAPDAVRKLVRVVNRMGRKEGGHISLITQGMKEINAIDPEVISSTAIRTLLVRDDDWDEIGEALSMPVAAREIWKSYENNLERLNYRQCMRLFNGRYYDLFLTFPELVLDITTTNRTDREIRHQVEKETKNIFERLRKFKERRAA